MNMFEELKSINSHDRLMLVGALIGLVGGSIMVEGRFAGLGALILLVGAGSFAAGLLTKQQHFGA